MTLAIPFANHGSRIQHQTCTCDWCNKVGPTAPTQDVEDGPGGQLYDVCSDCRDRQDAYIQATYNDPSNDFVVY